MSAPRLGAADDLARRPFRTAPEVCRVLFMIVEHFAGGDPAPVYERFADRGRLAPPGLDYLDSWVSSDLTRCYQVMECADRALLDVWMAQWADLVRFEVVEVTTSAEAAAEVARRRATSPSTAPVPTNRLDP